MERIGLQEAALENLRTQKANEMLEGVRRAIDAKVDINAKVRCIKREVYSF